VLVDSSCNGNNRRRSHATSVFVAVVVAGAQDRAWSGTAATAAIVGTVAAACADVIPLEALEEVVVVPVPVVSLEPLIMSMMNKMVLISFFCFILEKCSAILLGSTTRSMLQNLLLICAVATRDGIPLMDRRFISHPIEYILVTSTCNVEGLKFSTL
jgi:hypothetical protein